MKKIFSMVLALVLAAGLFSACGASASNSQSVQPEQKTVFRIAGLKGPTTMGMVKMMSDAEAGTANHEYTVTMYGTADEIVPKLISGEIDVAAVPANLAAVLYKKTQGKVQVAAINTLGVLYMVESGNSVQSVADLKGKTIYTTGKGTTPEYVLNYVLSQNGIDPQKDVTIEYKSEATEVAAMLSSGENVIALLPEPYVTTVKMKNAKVQTVLNMTEEWNKISPDSALVTGVVIARTEFINANPKAFQTFLSDYAASVQFVNSDTAAAAALVAKYDIVPEAVGQKAIPLCNITFIASDEMQQKLSGYLNVLYKQNPASVGGTLPDEAFYYKK